MPRAGQTKPPVMHRLSDRIAIGVLARTFPPELVDRVIAKCGRAERRQVTSQAAFPLGGWPGPPARRP
jgi:Insertion element 4 transposase N-terminal